MQKDFKICRYVFTGKIWEVYYEVLIFEDFDLTKNIALNNIDPNFHVS